MFSSENLCQVVASNVFPSLSRDRIKDNPHTWTTLPGFGLRDEMGRKLGNLPHACLALAFQSAVTVLAGVLLCGVGPR